MKMSEIEALQKMLDQYKTERARLEKYRYVSSHSFYYHDYTSSSHLDERVWKRVKETLIDAQRDVCLELLTGLSKLGIEVKEEVEVVKALQLVPPPVEECPA